MGLRIRIGDRVANERGDEEGESSVDRENSEVMEIGDETTAVVAHMLEQLPLIPMTTKTQAMVKPWKEMRQSKNSRTIQGEKIYQKEDDRLTKSKCTISLR